MNNLIDIQTLTIEEINNILSRANEFEKGIRKANHSRAHVTNMFFENSTRTKLSFEMAQNKLAINKYDFQVSTSSILKGEDLFDTINNLSAIGMDLIVLRHCDDNLIKELSSKTYFQNLSFVNAGSGKYAHPTQALLDLYTLKKHFVDIKGKTITIVGDIAHSRVANSDIALFKRFGAKIRCLCPKYFMGEKIEGVDYFENTEEALDGSDVVIALRIQKERIEENIDFDEYIKNYQITSKNLPYSAILMHPGPINKGIEVSREVLETKNARAILNQARNGVWTRMAVLDMILTSKGL